VLAALLPVRPALTQGQLPAVGPIDPLVETIRPAELHPAAVANGPGRIGTPLNAPATSEVIRPSRPPAIEFEPDPPPVELAPVEPSTESPELQPAPGSSRRRRGAETVSGRTESVAREAEAADSGRSRGVRAVPGPKFFGIQPGVTTRAQLLERWGEPSGASGAELPFQLEGLGPARVFLVRDRVERVRVELPEPIPADELRRRLVTIGPPLVDPGPPVRQEYPASGLYLTPVANDPTRIQAFELGPIHPARIAVQHRRALAVDAASIGPLIEALERTAPESGLAEEARAIGFERTGDWDGALSAARRAVEHDPGRYEARRVLARLLLRQGSPSEALAEAKRAAVDAAGDPLAQARALADLAAVLEQGPGRDYVRAAELRLLAAGMLRPRVEAVPVDIAATASSAEHHAALAADFAWGPWTNKDQAVPQWLARAEELARALPNDDPATIETRFAVARHALAALAVHPAGGDLAKWTEEVQARAEQLTSRDAGDPATVAAWRWELGWALADAAQGAQRANRFDEALGYGRRSLDELDAGEAARPTSPADAYALARVRYRTGALEARPGGDLNEAVALFEQALPELEAGRTMLGDREAGRHGQALSTIATAYWRAGRRDDATRLATAGMVDLRRAVERGLLQAESLRTPEANLARMHREQGSTATPASFERPATSGSAGTGPEARREGAGDEAAGGPTLNPPATRAAATARPTTP
jgi:hypothetical protein